MPKVYVSMICALLLTAACEPKPAPQARTTPQRPQAARPAEAPGQFAVLVSAKFASPELAKNKQAHDQVAKAGESQAKANGCLHHNGVVGLADPSQFLAIDLWNSASGIKQFFSNPEFRAGMSKIFSGSPTVATYRVMKDWASWGSLDLSKGGIVVVVRGTLIDGTQAQRQQIHDAVANGGKPVALANGDVAHLAFVDAQDPSQFMAIDLWKDPRGLQKFVSDPKVKAGFAKLFKGPPRIAVYRAADFYRY